MINSNRNLFYYAMLVGWLLLCVTGFADDEGAVTGKIETTESSMDLTSMVILSLFVLAGVGGIVWLVKQVREHSAGDSMEMDSFASQTLADFSKVNLRSSEELVDSPEIQPTEQTVPQVAKHASNSLETKLQAANLIDQHVGFVAVADFGQVPMVQLKDGRTAMLFEQVPDSATIRHQLRRCDILFICINDSDAIAIETMGEFIARKIAF